MNIHRTAPQPPLMQQHISLYELNSLVANVISTTMPHSYWVEAELSEGRENRGHFYMELIQKEEGTNTPIARASAKCWRTTWSQVKPYFERITGLQVRAGLKLLLQVHAQFHPQYGFSWIVDNINPEYTMGDMVRRRQEIIRQLKAEGVFDLQKELRLPLFARHIAVISSETAAGYGDFCNQLENNEYGFVFDVRLFPAIMQGEQAERSIIAALDAINEREEEMDCVVIIRGGGATADLSGFDTLQLAENVANFPLPVITGIGHERDESILDMIAHTRVKTPTAAAAFLVGHLAGTLQRIETAQERLSIRTRERMEREHLRLQRLSANIPTLFSLVRQRQEMRIERKLQRITVAVAERQTKGTHRLEMLATAIPQALQRNFAERHHRLEMLSQRAESLDPDRLLRLGYSITYYDGQIVRNPRQLRTGDRLTTKTEKGCVESTVV